MAEYNNNPNLGAELGWDDEISEESSFVLLEKGRYPFTVTGFERKRFPGSAKMCACNQVALKLSINGVTVEDNLFLNKKTEWTLSQFFVCIGQKQPGVPFRPDWNRIVGATGVCEVGVRTWTGNDGVQRQGNEIKEYCAPDAAAPKAPQNNAWQQQTMPGYQTQAGHWQAGKF